MYVLDNLWNISKGNDTIDTLANLLNIFKENNTIYIIKIYSKDFLCTKDLKISYSSAAKMCSNFMAAIYVYKNILKNPYAQNTTKSAIGQLPKCVQILCLPFLSYACCPSHSNLIIPLKLKPKPRVLGFFDLKLV